MCVLFENWRDGSGEEWGACRQMAAYFPNRKTIHGDPCGAGPCPVLANDRGEKLWGSRQFVIFDGSNGPREVLVMSSTSPLSQQLVLELDLVGPNGVTPEEAAQFHKTRRAYRACLNCRARKVSPV